MFYISEGRNSNWLAYLFIYYLLTFTHKRQLSNLMIKTTHMVFTLYCSILQAEHMPIDTLSYAAFCSHQNTIILHNKLSHKTGETVIFFTLKVPDTGTLDN